MRNLLLIFALYLCSGAFTEAWSQSRVDGKIIDVTSGEPLPGAVVLVKGSTQSALSDLDGNFSIATPGAGSVLVFNFTGYTPQEYTVTGNDMAITISMVEALALIDEVVVVGYGLQKKSVVTGAISSLKSRDIEKVPSNRVEQALQGRVSGVMIAQNSGQPGSPSTIRVRGITTFGDAGNNPLWVVDGVVVDQAGIAYLNQSDIESIEVLKDAASAAIYGTRAATGVILITTKKGESGKLRVAYNGFFGVSSPDRRLDLLNATQYATILNERAVNAGQSPMFADPASYGEGTDWQDVIFDNSAARYSHEVSLSGGNDRSTFYLSFGTQDQDGIVASSISTYNRKNLRLNSTHKIGKIFTLGQNLGYSHQRSSGLGNTNSEYGGPLSSAINLDPITPLVVTDPTVANAPPYSVNPVIRDANGNPFGISTLVGQEMTNPGAYEYTRLGGYGWSDDFIGNAFLEAAITKDITIRSNLGGKLSYWGSEGFTPLFFLSPTVRTLQNNFNKSNNNLFNWNIENTITYSRLFGKHDLSVLLGQGAYVENIGGGSSNTLFNLPITDYRDASFNFDIPQANRNSSTYDAVQHKIASLFARVTYNFDEKYLFTGIIRRDGSSRFGTNNKYGVFPSFSVGWNVSNEDFWPENNVVTRLKLRGGYGVVGNDAIRNFGYLATVNGGFNYTYGYSDGIVTGYAPSTLDNPDLHWEETAQTNIGFDASLGQAFNLTFDYFNKKTTGILRPITIPGYVGVSESPVANIADMSNKGFEVELGYRTRAGKFDLYANGNFSYVSNKVLYVASDNDFIVGDASFQTMGAITRTQVGHSYNEFFGLQMDGIFQNQTEINNYRNADGELLQPNARPGDIRWVDVNGDGQITFDDEDKTFLGSSLPKYIFGLTLGFDVANFDFMVFAQGNAGNMIFQGLRRLDMGLANYSTAVLGRWTGEGSTNEYPILSATDPNGNFSNMSELYLEKGDYARLKLVQLGYSIRGKWMDKVSLSRLRVYVTAENLLTLTGYTGYDPEIGGTVFGVDKGVYPQARSFLFGLQVQF